MEATQTQSTEQAQASEQALSDQTQATETKLAFNQHKLPNGQIATVRRPKGRDVRDAERLAGGDGEITLGMAIASVVTSVNGEPVIYEDFLDWNLGDCQAVIAIYKAMSGK